MEGIDRRTFVQRTGVVGAAIGAASLGSSQALERALAAAAEGGLTARNRKTYRGLVDAVVASDNSSFRPSDAAGAPRRFEAWLDDQDDVVRGQVKTILQDVEGGYEKGSFADAADEAKLKHMREWAYPYSDYEPPTWDITATEEEQRKAAREALDGLDVEMPGGDFTAVKPVPLAYDPPPPPKELPKLNVAEERRAMIMDGALDLAVIGLVPDAVGRHVAVAV